MAFHLSTANVSAAKEVAERSFGRISFRQEGERLNAWCALLTLELKYGSDEALQRTIDRACQSNNPKHVHLRVCEMLGKEAAASSDAVGALQRADDMYAKLCKKFKSKKKAWLAHIEHLLKSDRSDEALALSKKALLSLPEYKHRETMAKVAQLVFEHGNPEQARTLFDGLLARYPKRLDLFSVFVDKEVKHGSVSAARVLFERQASTSNHDRRPKLKLTDKQMKGFFKKWYAFETQHGDASLRERVKDAARAYVEQSS